MKEEDLKQKIIVNYKNDSLATNKRHLHGCKAVNTKLETELFYSSVAFTFGLRPRGFPV